nr:DNA-directed DNA polymerase [Tanacetum cinerariifolium]
MRTRSSSNLIVEPVTIPKRRNRRRSKRIVEPEFRTIVETRVTTMADACIMSELLQAPTEGYGDAIVILAILADNFDFKVGLLQLVTSSQFHGFEMDDPQAHIRWFNKITYTLKYQNVSNEAIKLMLFLFSLDRAARIWLEKEPPHSILTWEDLVSKFVNHFFPHSKTTNFKNDITNFQQRFDESFGEAWDRFKDLLHKCPHHGFSELHHIDAFYNALTQSDQDSLNAAAGGNLLNCTPRDALMIIESKSKVHISRNNPIVSKVSTTTSSPSPSLDVTALTEIVKELVLMNKATQQATVKAIKETCVTCGGPHPSYECLATGGNTFDACAARQSASGSRSLPSDTVANPRGNMKAITTQSGVAYEGPSIPPTSYSLPKEVEREPESLLSNKEKLFELAKLEECFALADLDGSINLMPLSVWKKRSLSELTPTRMTLELTNRSVAYLVGVDEDVFVKVGKFHFLANFVVVDYDGDPQVPLILKRPFLKTARALIDVHGKELTLRVIDEAITFKVGHTSRYSCNYDDELVNQIDVIDVTCEKYAQEVLGFSDSLKSGNPSPNLPPMKNEDLKKVDVTMTNPSIEEPPELKLKDLPPYLEYSFLEETDKLPIIISKELKDEEKDALLKVLKSHKRAIAWKFSNIKGINPRFCTHKILMEDDFKPAVQHQRRVNPKIHEVIKKEVIKLLDAGLIYSIFDSPWVSPVRCVPKNGGMTVVKNEDNELIPTRLVTGWRIPIDPQDQEKTSFTCPYGTFAYRHMPFGLCNAPGTFQRCMMAIFHDIIEETMEEESHRRQNSYQVAVVPPLLIHMTTQYQVHGENGGGIKAIYGDSGSNGGIGDYGGIVGSESIAYEIPILSVEATQRKGFKKKRWNCLEFKNEYFQQGKQHLLRTIKRRNQQTKVINNTPLLYVPINKLKATFDIDLIIDLVDIEEDLESMYDLVELYDSDIEGLTMLSDLREKGATLQGCRGDGACKRGDGRRVPPFLHKLYNIETRN